MKLKKNLMVILLFLVSVALHFLSGNPEMNTLVFKIRAFLFLEELFIAVILSSGGLILQTLMQNPLAEPYLLGVSGGAAFGAVLAVFLGLVPLVLFRSLFALLGAALVSLLVFLLSMKRIGFSISTAILTGVAVNALFSGLIMLTQSLLSPNELQTSVHWLLGQVRYGSIYEIFLLLFGALLVSFFLIFRQKELSILLSGSEMAEAVGVESRKIKLEGFFTVSVAAGCAVSISGMIGFLGLLAPHLARLVFGSSHKDVMVPMWLIAGSLMLIAGVLSRELISGTVLPVGVVISVIGAPFFIRLLQRKDEIA